MAKYTLKGKDFSKVFNGTNASADPLNLGYYNFPGTVNNVDSHKFGTDSLIRPLDTQYKYMLGSSAVDMASNRYAKFDDFEWIANNPEQLINAPAETTHISGILIGGGGGGGASGGGNNPQYGADTAGAGGGGGGGHVTSHADRLLHVDGGCGLFVGERPRLGAGGGAGEQWPLQQLCFVGCATLCFCCQHHECGYRQRAYF